MGEVEKGRAQAEAIEAASRGSASARRNRMWAAMNRYLGSEERHAVSSEEETEQRRAGSRDQD